MLSWVIWRDLKSLFSLLNSSGSGRWCGVSTQDCGQSHGGLEPRGMPALLPHCWQVWCHILQGVLQVLDWGGTLKNFSQAKFFNPKLANRWGVRVWGVFETSAPHQTQTGPRLGCQRFRWGTSFPSVYFNQCWQLGLSATWSYLLVLLIQEFRKNIKRETEEYSTARVHLNEVRMLALFSKGARWGSRMGLGESSAPLGISTYKLSYIPCQIDPY